MPTVDDLLQELRQHRRQIATLFADGGGDEEDASVAATRHEAEATRHAEDAARHREAARKAREDNDEEDASQHLSAARASYSAAAKCRADAKAAYEAAAKKLRGDGGDEEAAKQYDAAATALSAADATASHDLAAAEAEAARHEEDATKRKGGMTDNVLPMLAMFLRAMTEDGKNMAAMKDTDNLSLLKGLMHAMTYPAGGPLAKRGQGAKHDDEPEDTALFRRLMRQYKDDDDMHASRNVADIRLERRFRSMEAAMGEMGKLLTDVVHSLRDLATDGASARRGLKTDTHDGVNGGPVRKTMSANGGEYRGKFDDETRSAKRTEDDIDAQLDAQHLTPVERMAAKLQHGWAQQQATK